MSLAVARILMVVADDCFDVVVLHEWNLESQIAGVIYLGWMEPSP
jgi:hypothetical protein